MSVYDWIFKDLQLDGKIVLDAATGAGEATAAWAKYIHEHRFNARIVSVDNELPQEWVQRLRTKFGPLNSYIELHQADIYNLAFMEDGSVDIINCDDTIVFLNPRPLKLLAAVKEFKRVLKPGGTLIIVSEFPPDNTPQAEGNWRRWNLAKAIWALNGETWSTEPFPQEVQAALELLGFKAFVLNRFPCRPLADYQTVIHEWEEVMEAKICTIPWPGLRQALRKQVQAVIDRIHGDGYLLTPERFVLKSTKYQGEDNENN